jgi:hypothetical protein
MQIMDEFTRYHTLEISSSICPGFSIGERPSGSGTRISQRDLALISGSLSHEFGSVEVADDGASLRVEWLQNYPV